MIVKPIDSAKLKSVSDFRSEVWNQAIQLDDTELFGAFEHDELVGVVAIRRYPQSIKLISISSYRHGAGEALCRHVSSLGCPIWGKGVASASEFYERLGAKPMYSLKVGKLEGFLYLA